MTLGLDMHARVQMLRQKARDNQLTLEETREALQYLRGDRARAQATSTKSRGTKAAGKKAVDSDGLLGELDGL